MKRLRRNKRFRCGRAVLMRDGTVKTISLGKGGGTRFCQWNNGYMSFDDVRARLIDLFKLGDIEQEILLYDYQLRPLDLEQYNTLFNYVRHNGLNGNSTIIYLCTREVDGDQSQKKVMKKKKKKKKQTEHEEKKSPSTATLIKEETIIKIEPWFESKQTNPSLSDYSFASATRDLVKHVRHLISENIGDDMLLQLFENCCIIHGHVSFLIEPFQKNNQSLPSSHSSEHLNRFNDIEHIRQSIEGLLHSKKEKLNQMEQYSLIDNIFNEFSRNLKNLREQWIQHVEKEPSVTHLSSVSLNNQSLSEDRTDGNPIRPNREICAVFQPLLNSATDLLDLLNTPRLISFRTMIKWFITDLEAIRSNVDLHNYRSLCDAKQAVTSLKIRYTRKFTDQAFQSSTFQMTHSVKLAHRRTLRAICDLLTTLQDYQLKTDEEDVSRNPNVSSSSLPKTRRKQFENNRSNGSKKIKREDHHEDHDDQMDVAIYSSSGIQ